MGMRILYGSYEMSPEQRNPASISLYQVRPDYSERGYRMSQIHEVHLRGEILVDEGITDDAEARENIATKVAALAAAFQENGKDLRSQRKGTDGQYYDTAHCLYENHEAAMSHVQVVYRSWPESSPAEFATQRTYYVILRQRLAAAESVVMNFWQTIEVRGAPGAYVEWHNTPTGEAVYQDVHLNPMSYIVQTGGAVGYQVYPLIMTVPPNPGAPIYGYPYEDVRHRIIRFTRPQYTGKGYFRPGVEWRYVFRVPLYNIVTPPLYRPSQEPQSET